MTLIPWLVFIGSAILEVGGDALIRKGLHGRGVLLIIAGVAALGSYGLLVNTVRWDFSKLLGVYIAVFAIVSVLWGRFIFRENIPTTTWVGIGVIALGGFIIQFGQTIVAYFGR